MSSHPIQRRHFLQGMTALAGSQMIAPVWAERAAGPIVAAQIGTKHAHASGQMQTMRALPDLFRVIGIVEPDDAQYTRVASQAAYRDLPRMTQEELLDRADLQVVAVETEVRDLLPTASACLAAGKHIHLDKPAGETLSELAAIQQIARQHRLVIQMGYMFRYNPAFEFLYRAADAGWLGTIFEVHGVMSKKVDQRTRQELAEYPGGSMFELGCHLVDPLVRLLGSPENVTCFHRNTQGGDELLDNMLAVLEYPQATATIRSSLLEVDGGRRRQFVVCGDRGTIAILPLEAPALTLTLESPQGDFPKGTREISLPRSEGRYHGAWKALAAAVRGETEFPYTLEHDYTVQRALLAASGGTPW